MALCGTKRICPRKFLPPKPLIKLKQNFGNFFPTYRVKLVQWQGDAYDQDLLERTRDACRGDVDIVIGCINLGAPLQRSFKCLKKGGIAFLTEEMNEKVLKSLEKLAEQQNRQLKVVDRCSDNNGNLANLLKLVEDGHVSRAEILLYIF